MSDDKPKKPRRPQNRPKAETQAMEARVMSLRLAGMPFDQIAREVGYSDQSGAYRAYQRIMERTVRPMADEVREEEVARLDRLIMSYWPRALGGGGHDPNPKAADVVFRAMDRRAKLLGLDAPVKQEIDLTTYTPEDFDREVAEIAALIDRTDPAP